MSDYLTNARRAELVAERAGDRCHCGAEKKSGKAVCSGCFGRLPVELRVALFRGMGAAYGEARDAAVGWIKGREVPE